MKKSSSLGRVKTETVCTGKLWSLCPWTHAAPNWTESRATCSSWPCCEQVGGTSCTPVVLVGLGFHITSGQWIYQSGPHKKNLCYMWTTHNHRLITVIKLIYLANSCPLPLPPPASPTHTLCTTERKQYLEIICFHANCKDVGSNTVSRWHKRDNISRAPESVLCLHCKRAQPQRVTVWFLRAFKIRT